MSWFADKEFHTRLRRSIYTLSCSLKPGSGKWFILFSCRVRLKYDGTCAETRFGLSAKRTSPFKSAGASVFSTTGSRGVRISGSNAGYTMFCGSVKGTGYPIHSPVSPSLPLPCVTVCHQVLTELYRICADDKASLNNSRNVITLKLVSCCKRVSIYPTFR
jgi:hypothetical protein